MQVTLLGGGPVASNCYLLQDGDERAIVDPSLPLDTMLEALDGHDLTMIIVTHRHYDHICCLAALQEKTAAPTYAYESDADAICDNSPYGNASSEDDAIAIEGADYEGIKPVDVRLKDGDTVTLGTTKMQVIHTPGHSAGSMCLYDEAGGNLIAGDTLFANGSFGRTDLPSGSASDMRNSLARLSKLPDDVIVYPGHGPVTTIGSERGMNPYL
ncbi:MAG: MBL fold metallo-hydrolase [Coriobacteriaceae bacterium]|nr:MBL fold metallo-hydrolase [Coriobacteriaceae bacterium]